MCGSINCRQLFKAVNSNKSVPTGVPRFFNVRRAICRITQTWKSDWETVSCFLYFLKPSSLSTSSPASFAINLQFSHAMHSSGLHSSSLRLTDFYCCNVQSVTFRCWQKWYKYSKTAKAVDGSYLFERRILREI